MQVTLYWMMNSLQTPADLIERLDRHRPPAWLLDFGASVQAGFPSPAQDLGAKRIDLTAEPGPASPGDIPDARPR